VKVHINQPFATKAIMGGRQIRQMDQTTQLLLPHVQEADDIKIRRA
jgi:hypothetical protein